MTRFRLSVTLIACAVLLVAATPASAAVRHLGDRTLRAGSAGDDVRGLQQLLSRAGFKATTDGTFGQGTRRAVRRFQRAARIRPTGVAGPGTIRRLRAAAKSAGAAPPATDGGATALARPQPAGPQRPPASGAAATAAGPTTGAAGPAGAASAAGAAGPAGPTGAAGPTGTATLRADGTAVAPADAPPEIVAMIEAGNRIAILPYRYGGGHQSFEDTAYDCSGSVSYSLHGADLLDSPLASGGLGEWGAAGSGRWVTIYANDEHVYMVVAGLRFDTSGQKQSGSRWQTAPRSNKGFIVRHPAGL
jgi:peptidoglycan hydrolase-like protein with peptidoglycan-binding domain